MLVNMKVMNMNLKLAFLKILNLKSKFRQCCAKIEKSHQIYLKMCTFINLKLLNKNLTGFSFSQNLLLLLDNLR